MSSSAHGFVNVAVSSSSATSAEPTSTKFPMLSTQQPRSSERVTRSASTISEMPPQHPSGAKAALMLSGDAGGLPIGLPVELPIQLPVELPIRLPPIGLLQGLLTAARRELVQSRSDFNRSTETVTTEPVERKGAKGLAPIACMPADMAGLSQRTKLCFES
jgi:hypothetical protein